MYNRFPRITVNTKVTFRIDCSYFHRLCNFIQYENQSFLNLYSVIQNDYQYFLELFFNIPNNTTVKRISIQTNLSYTSFKHKRGIQHTNNTVLYIFLIRYISFTSVFYDCIYSLQTAITNLQ